MKNIPCPNCLNTGAKFKHGRLSHKCGYRAIGTDAAAKYVERLKNLGKITSDVSIEICEICDSHAKIRTKDGTMCFACGKEKDFRESFTTCDSCKQPFLYDSRANCPECREKLKLWKINHY